MMVTMPSSPRTGDGWFDVPGQATQFELVTNGAVAGTVWSTPTGWRATGSDMLFTTAILAMEAVSAVNA